MLEGVCAHSERERVGAEDADVRVDLIACGGAAALVDVVLLVAEVWFVVALEIRVERFAGDSVVEVAVEVERLVVESVGGGWKSFGWFRVATILSLSP